MGSFKVKIIFSMSLCFLKKLNVDWYIDFAAAHMTNARNIYRIEVKLKQRQIKIVSAQLHDIKGKDDCLIMYIGTDNEFKYIKV